MVSSSCVAVHGLNSACELLVITSPRGSTTTSSHLLISAELNWPPLRNEFGSTATPVPRNPNEVLVPGGGANCFTKKSVSCWPNSVTAEVSMDRLQFLRHPLY